MPFWIWRTQRFAHTLLDDYNHAYFALDMRNVRLISIPVAWVAAGIANIATQNTQSQGIVSWCHCGVHGLRY
jgi:hypothetical protein